DARPRRGRASRPGGAPGDAGRQGTARDSARRARAGRRRRAVSLGDRRRGFVERGPLDFARLEHFEDVAFLHVVEAFEENAALEAFGHLARVVLEAFERSDRRRVDDGAVPDDAHVGVPAHDAVRDHAAGDRAETRDLEQRANLGLADRLLRLDGGELADERLLDVVGELVDDVVRADLDALARRELARLRVRTYVEPDDERVGRRREHDVVL